MDRNTGSRQVAGGESRADSLASSEAGATGTPGGEEGMDRVRVRARTLDGRSVSMVGLLPREALEDLKARISRLERETGKRYHLEARLKPEAAAEVRGGWEPGSDRGLKVVVGVAIKEDAEEVPVECEATEA